MVGEPSAIGGRELAWDPERMTTLRALISALVAEELAGYAERQQQRSLLRVITPDDLAKGTDTGRYATGPRTPQPAPPHDVAVAHAVEAFDDGLYYVVRRRHGGVRARRPADPHGRLPAAPGPPGRPGRGLSAC